MPFPSARPLRTAAALSALSSFLLLPAATSAASSTLASSAARVEAVQAPAWVERQGRQQPLPAGQTLRAGDRLITGPGGRVQVALADGSQLKLGEAARTQLNTLDNPANGPFTAAVAVSGGAFRLTTDALQKTRRQRAIEVRVGTVTAGIRGTDLWGKNDQERDLICLLEGQIEVHHQDGDRQMLDQAYSFYAAPRGSTPARSQAEAEQVNRWASETELPEAGSAQWRQGGWQVVVGPYPDAAHARADQSRLATAGTAARVQASGGRYRLLLQGYADAASAERAAAHWQAALGQTSRMQPTTAHR